jgi:hypothetical protein
VLTWLCIFLPYKIHFKIFITIVDKAIDGSIGISQQERQAKLWALLKDSLGQDTGHIWIQKVDMTFSF